MRLCFVRHTKSLVDFQRRFVRLQMKDWIVGCRWQGAFIRMASRPSTLRACERSRYIRVAWDDLHVLSDCVEKLKPTEHLEIVSEAVLNMLI